MNITNQVEFDAEAYNQVCPTDQDKEDVADAAFAAMKGKTPAEINQFAYEVQKRVMEVEYDYDIHASLGASKLGGCLSVDEWLKTPAADDLDAAIRKVVHRRHAEGKCRFLIAQFGWNLGADLAFNMLI